MVKLNIDDKDLNNILSVATRMVVAIEKIARDLDNKEIVISLREKEVKKNG